jgi:hypothetical protein
MWFSFKIKNSINRPLLPINKEIVHLWERKNKEEEKPK